MTDYASVPIPSAQPTIGYVERPWGFFEQYAHNQAVTVSLMSVKPAQWLSLLGIAVDAPIFHRLQTGAQVYLSPQTSQG